MAALTVWKRDRDEDTVGVECPHCTHRIELIGITVSTLEEGRHVVRQCGTCLQGFDVTLEALGGHLWPPAPP
jgi:hypothetical protein